MEVKDIVRITNTSRCMFHNIRDLQHYEAGHVSDRRRWMVLATRLMLPTHFRAGLPEERNDTILCEADNPSVIPYIQHGYCRVVDSPRKQPEPVGVSMKFLKAVRLGFFSPRRQSWCHNPPDCRAGWFAGKDTNHGHHEAHRDRTNLEPRVYRAPGQRRTGGHGEAFPDVRRETRPTAGLRKEQPVNQRQFVLKWRKEMGCESFKEPEAPMVCWCKTCVNLERIWREIHEVVKEKVVACI